MKITVGINDLKDIPAYREAGATSFAVALKGCAQTALIKYEIEDIKDIEHVSVLMNRLFFEEEMPGVVDVMKQLENMDNVEHVYFADPAVLYNAGNALKNKLVYRPETLVTSAPDASFWKEQGIYGVTISPILTEEEVAVIGKSVANSEVMIHGRLLMSMSRRRLLERYTEYSNANVNFDGMTNLSLKEKTRDTRMPVFEDELGTLIYTDYVQHSFAKIVNFREHGVQDFYMTGEFSTSQELLDALKAYKRILNGENAEEIMSEYATKYSYLPLEEGYYGQKTIK